MSKARNPRKSTARSSASTGQTAGSAPGIKSIEIAGRILRALSQHPRATTLKEISRSSGLPPPKLHRYLVSLVRIGLVRQNVEDKTYGLGAFSMEIGALAARSSDALVDAATRLRRLRDSIDETIVLSIWSPLGPIILDVEESSRPVVMTMRRGTVLPVLSTATGIVFCALLPRFQTVALVERELAGLAESNPIVKSTAELDELLTSVRERGYAINSGHLLPEIIALAAPIVDRAGRLTAVLGVIGRERRIDPSWDKTVLTALLKIASHGH